MSDQPPRSALQGITPIEATLGFAAALAVFGLGVWAVLPKGPKAAGGPGRGVRARARTAGGDVKINGWLAQAVQDQTYVPITWVDIPGPAGMTITVAADLLKAPAPPPDGPPLRLSASFNENIAMAKALSNQLGFGVIVPSKQIADAIYNNAAVKTVFHTQVLAPGDSQHMESIQFSQNYNNDIDNQIASALGGPPAADALVSGAEKLWLLSDRLTPSVNEEFMARSGLKPAYPQVAINYGGWGANGVPQQPVGGQHEWNHQDTSQLFRAVKRMAVDANGQPVDLLSWMESAENVGRKYTDMFRFDATTV